MKLSSILTIGLATSASAFVASSTPPTQRQTTTLLAVNDATDVATPMPNPIIKLAANGMTLLKPIFALEANLQAVVLGAISNVDKVSKRAKDT